MRINDGAQTRDRTTDTRIFSPLLYQLSYLGTPDFLTGALGFITLKFRVSSLQNKNIQNLP